MFSAILGLRGKNLSDALGSLIRKFHVDIKPGMSKKMADYVLTHPTISDSLLADWKVWFSIGWRGSLVRAVPGWLKCLRRSVKWVFKQ
jgi:hypothetical protein